MSITESRSGNTTFRPISSGLFGRTRGHLFEWDPFLYPTRHEEPRANIREDDDHYVIELALPGVDKKDVIIEQEGHVIEVSKEKEEVSQEGEQVRREHHHGPFHRAFYLPSYVDVDEAPEAVMKDGVLIVRCSKKKRSSAPQHRRIEIS